MNPSHVVKLLKLFDCKVPVAQNRGGWIVSDCPFGPWNHDGGKSSPEVFGVKKQQGDPFCNCFSCGWHGTLGTMLIELRAKNKTSFNKAYDFAAAALLVEEAEKQIEIDLETPGIEEILFGAKPQPHVFPEAWLASYPMWYDADWCLDYLAERHVPIQVANLLDIRADMKQERVCFPIRGFDGTLYGFHGRSIHKAVEPRYRMYPHKLHTNPKFWLGEHWIDLSKPIVVVEGPFDLASVMRVYRNVTSPLFVNPSVEKLLRMADALEWITIYDRGTGGDAGRRKVTKTLHKDHVVTHLHPPAGCKDPGVMTIEQLCELLEGHVKFDQILVD